MPGGKEEMNVCHTGRDRRIGKLVFCLETSLFWLGFLDFARPIELFRGAGGPDYLALFVCTWACDLSACHEY